MVCNPPDIEAFPQTVNAIAEARELERLDFDILRIVPTCYDARTNSSRECVQTLREQGYSELLSDTVLSQSVGLKKIGARGAAIDQKYKGFEDVLALCTELATRMVQAEGEKARVEGKAAANDG